MNSVYIFIALSLPQIYTSSHELWPLPPRVQNKWLVVDVCASTGHVLNLFFSIYFAVTFDSRPPAALVN